MIRIRRSMTAGRWQVACLAALLSLALGGFVYAEFPAAGSAANSEQIANLVRDLGNERFSAREAASDRLARIGLPAFAALEEASQHADREIRFRAERILALIRKNDLQRRLAAFIAGVSKDDDDELPAWTRFKKGYGDTEMSRQWFVEMQRAEAELLATLQRDPRSAVEVLGRRLQERQMTLLRGPGSNNATPLSKGEISTYLFVAGEEDVPASANSIDSILRLVNQSALYQPVRMSQEGDMQRKLLGRTIRRCDAASAYQAMLLASSLGLKEGLIPAQKVLQQHDRPNGVPVQALTAALACVTEFGNRSDVPAVEKLLENQTHVTSSATSVVQDGKRVIIKKELQVRDAALAAVVLLTKQDGEEYFGQAIAPRSSPSPLSRFQPQTVGFENDEQRAIALGKWAAYKSRQQAAKDPAAAGGENGSP